MAELFGLDIQSIVAEAIQAGGGLTASTLTKSTGGGRDPNQPTVLLAPSITTHTLEAVVEARQVRLQGTAVAETKLVMTMITGTISPPAVPAVNDRVELAGIIYTLVTLLERDPAEATYQFEVA